MTSVCMLLLIDCRFFPCFVFLRALPLVINFPPTRRALTDCCFFIRKNVAHNGLSCPLLSGGEDRSRTQYYLEFSRALVFFFVHPPTVFLEKLGVGLVRFPVRGQDNESLDYVARAQTFIAVWVASGSPVVDEFLVNKWRA